MTPWLWHALLRTMPRLCNGGPLPLLAQVADGTVAPVLPRNTPVPCKVTHTMAAAGPEQTAVCLRVYEGERLLTRDNTLLGTVALDGLAPQAEVWMTAGFSK